MHIIAYSIVVYFLKFFKFKTFFYEYTSWLCTLQNQPASAINDRYKCVQNNHSDEID